VGLIYKQYIFASRGAEAIIGYTKKLVVQEKYGTGHGRRNNSITTNMNSKQHYNLKCIF
jgi:hypothetical protein